MNEYLILQMKLKLSRIIFLNRMKVFTMLSDIERQSKQEKSKAKPSIDIDIDLSGDTSFDAF